MCTETMGTKAKQVKTGCLRKNMKFGSKLRWRLLPLSAEEDEALKQCRATAVRATIRKYLRREQRRIRQNNLFRVWGHMSRKEKREFAYEKRPAAACAHRHPAGAMAPENTTQYLMGNVYEDLQIDINQSVQASHQSSDCPSPRSWCTALDSESYLSFQQRNFEEVFNTLR